AGESYDSLLAFALYRNQLSRSRWVIPIIRCLGTSVGRFASKDDDQLPVEILRSLTVFDFRSLMSKHPAQAVQEDPVKSIAIHQNGGRIRTNLRTPRPSMEPCRRARVKGHR